MRYTINNYVNALAGALGETPDDKKGLVLKNFVSLIAKNGDLPKRDKIVESVHRQIVNSNGGKWVTVELARETTEPRMRIMREMFSDKDFINFKINPALVAGIRITINGEDEIDNSLQSKLNKLFK